MDELIAHVRRADVRSDSLDDQSNVDYVNPAQYRRICQRRSERMMRETFRPTQPRQKYLHESRHKHAINRVRGHKGRFVNLTTGIPEGEKECLSEGKVENTTTTAEVRSSADTSRVCTNELEKPVPSASRKTVLASAANLNVGSTMMIELPFDFFFDGS